MLYCISKIYNNCSFLNKVGLLLKGVLLILMVSSNTVGCTFFVKALNASGSSLPCTIASAATSYVCSVILWLQYRINNEKDVLLFRSCNLLFCLKALAGSLVFNESTSATWWCGILLVILGLFFISRAPTKAVSTEKLKQK